MEAAEQLGIHIPRLCYHPDLSLAGSCRVCVVDVKGMGYYMPSCSVKVWEGMEVQTNSPEIRQARRDIVELLLDNHNWDCQTCERDGHCELQNLAYRHGRAPAALRGRAQAISHRGFQPFGGARPGDGASSAAAACGSAPRSRASTTSASTAAASAPSWRPAHAAKMDESVCIQCGQCINVCPTAAFLEKRNTGDVWDALANPDLHVVVQTAPSIRAAIGEGFGLAPGTPVTGKMITALRRLGFDAVFDTNFGADLTIVEEAHEFLAPAGGRRPAADDHLLLAGLDQLPGKVLPGADPPRLHLQVADEHALDAGEDLLRGEEGARSRRRSTWWR